MSIQKILFILPNLNGGGAERVIVNIINSLDYTKYEVTLLLAQNSGVYFDKVTDKSDIKILNYKKVIFSLFGIKNEIKNVNPDIVFSTTHRMNFLVALASKLLKKKYTLCLRLPNSPKREFENNQLSFIQKRMFGFAYRSADLVIAQTPEMQSEIHKYFQVDEENITLLINPIDKKNIDLQIKNIENPFSANKINIVAAGRIIEQKGFDTLIKAMKSVVEKDKSFILNIIGQDVLGLQKDLEALAKRLNIEDHINFLGFQENPYQFFYYSDLFVLSSRWEGLPNAVLENLYLNKPIVSTHCIPFMDKLIDNENNGYLVDIEDYINLADKILKVKLLPMNKINIEYGNVNNFFNELKKLKK